MKLTEFFDSCSAEELTEVLGDLDEELPEGVDEERIRQKAVEGLRPAEKKPIRKSWVKNWKKIALATAASLCLVIGTGAVVAEAQEYHEAVDFFQENRLSMEGLTRAEIKEVYRDIVSDTFTYTRTAEVIQNSVLTGVKGMEIAQEAPNPDTARDYWNRYLEKRESGVHYRFYHESKMDEEQGFEVFDKSCLEKYDGETLVWRASVSEFYIEDWTLGADGLLVWGYEPTTSSLEESHAWLADVGDDGSVRWKRELKHGFRRESIRKVLDNGDGSYAVISRGETTHLVLSRFSSSGEELATRATEVGNLGIWNAVRLGDDYLVRLGNQSENVDRIVRVDRDGNLTDAFTYSAEDCDYYINDMAEFAGKLYLSAHAVPKLPDGGENAGGRYDIAAVLQDVLDEQWGERGEKWPTDNFQYADGALVERLRENYTAVLLVCDPEKGIPETFYSVPGSIGGRLDAREELVWDVESFYEAAFSPYTNSYSVRAECQVFRYTFDADGKLVGQEETEEVREFLAMREIGPVSIEF